MNKSFLSRCAIILLLSAGVPPSVAAPGHAHTDPAALGTEVQSIVEIGVVASSNYDVRITVLETVRGAEAGKRLGNSATPRAGYEFLLARVRFHLQGRSVSATQPFDLLSSPYQWVAFSSDFRQYEPAQVKAPEPALAGAVAPGASAEGWLVFEVEQAEPRPVLTFDPSSGGATGRGNILFFCLY